MAGPFGRTLVSAKNTALSSMRLQPGSFQVQRGYSEMRGNTRERRIPVTFVTADVATTIFHGLGFPPSGYQVLGIGGAAKVYNDFPIPSTSQVIVLKCDTANTVADILVR